MNLKHFKKLITIAVLLFVIASCDKIVNTTATITVVDEKAKLVSGATVHVFPSTSQPEDSLVVIGDLDETKITDSKGQVFFDYTDFYKRGQTGLFVLDMEVIYVLPDTTITVLSVFKIEEQVENLKEVVLPITL